MAGVSAVLLGLGLAASYERKVWRTWLSTIKFFSASKSADRGKGKEGIRFEGNGRAQLGSFSIRTFDPVTSTVLETDFQLEGLTTCTDEAQFWDFMDKHQRSFREQVMVAVRSSGSEDLADPKRLGRRIAARVNRTLDRPFLQTVDVKGLILATAVKGGPMLPLEPLEMPQP